MSMSISGHANEQSLANYNSRPSTSQLKNCSEILSHALEKGQAPSQTDLPSTTSCYSATSTRVVCHSCACLIAALLADCILRRSARELWWVTRLRVLWFCSPFHQDGRSVVKGNHRTTYLKLPKRLSEYFLILSFYYYSLAPGHPSSRPFFEWVYSIV